VSVRILEREDDLAELVSEWDALAIESGHPYCAPGWQLAWWRRAAPAGAELRIVAVEAGGGLAGIAPLAACPGPLRTTTYRLLAGTVSSPVEPLARPGCEREVARATAAALGRMEPRPGRLALDGLPAGSPWPGLLAEAWPGARLRRDEEMRAPFVHLEAQTHAEWLAARSGHFRKRMRAARRRLDERGAIIRRAERGELDAAVDAFCRLHHARWAAKGGSAVLDAGVEAMLADAARALGSDRFQVWLLELDGTPVAAEILLAAGGEIASWLGGFDPESASLQPSVQILVAALEAAWEAGGRRFDLGPGDHDFKRRLADGEATQAWTTLLPPGRAGLHSQIADVPARARHAARPYVPAAVRRLMKRR
jgi:CelD/BcsL family acetyltransferase involved in cellulose biosynthesis